MKSVDKVIYSLNLEDIQQVAQNEFDRKLTSKELQLVENGIDKFIDWYEAIMNTMQHVGITKQKSK